MIAVGLIFVILLAGRNLDYMKPNGTAASKDELPVFEKCFAVVSERLRAEGIPLMIFLMPDHAQVSLLSGISGAFPKLDAEYLNREVRAIAQGHGEVHNDIFKSFEGIQHPERDFFPVDEHMTESGHALLAHFIAEKLGAEPKFLDDLPNFDENVASKRQ